MGGDMVYIVTAGEYSDYHIEAVFSTKEAAERWIEVRQPYGGSIEEYAVDEPDPLAARAKRGQFLYRVSMYYDGEATVTQVSLADYDNPERWEDWRRKARRYYGDIPPNLSGGWATDRRGVPFTMELDGLVWAKDKRHAVKVANEERTRQIAAGEWQLLSKRAEDWRAAHA